MPFKPVPVTISQAPDIDPDLDAEIEIDEAGSSSDYGSSLESTGTQSLTSSIVDYVYENGRRYHRYSKGNYFLPNDEPEQDRLDIYHHINLMHLKGNLFTAPISPSPHRILDCGTGTGIWALDMAETYPSAEVIGVDLSPIQPTWTFPNCKFEVDDIERSWTFPKDHFDFIHSRDVANSIKDWPRYIEQMWRHTKPGGYIEISEFIFDIRSDDGTLSGSHLERYFKEFKSASTKAGFKYPDQNELAQRLGEMGFEDINIKQFKQPWGMWPKNPEMKKIGTMVQMATETGFDAYGLALFTRFGGFSHEDAKLLCELGKLDVRNRSIHSYIMKYNVYARKPLPEKK